ncbi:uncharacterized protein LOC104847574 [Fukomys damarensis]|uniref:uncharacterized protein LOC104847574 n=1 Tax=Fukomys damarensis TaxID=885580 RepID=UPI001455A420|nr:uncharacterized protein LOC104847574 [Fukomys damarensis]
MHWNENVGTTSKTASTVCGTQSHHSKEKSQILQTGLQHCFSVDSAYTLGSKFTMDSSQLLQGKLYTNVFINTIQDKSITFSGPYDNTVPAILLICCLILISVIV